MTLPDYNYTMRLLPILTVLLVLFDMKGATAQVFLQLEQKRSLETIKFSIGSKIYFQTTEFDGWQDGILKEIVPEEGILVFDDRITSVAEITKFRYERTVPRTIGSHLKTFGMAWLGFAGLIEGSRTLGLIDTEWSFDTDTGIVGGGSIVLGMVIKRLFGFRTVRINKKNRLRIVDLRISTGE